MVVEVIQLCIYNPWFVGIFPYSFFSIVVYIFPWLYTFKIWMRNTIFLHKKNGRKCRKIKERKSKKKNPKTKKMKE